MIMVIDKTLTITILSGLEPSTNFIARKLSVWMVLSERTGLCLGSLRSLFLCVGAHRNLQNVPKIMVQYTRTKSIGSIAPKWTFGYWASSLGTLEVQVSRVLHDPLHSPRQLNADPLEYINRYVYKYDREAFRVYLTYAFCIKHMNLFKYFQ